MTRLAYPLLFTTALLMMAAACQKDKGLSPDGLIDDATNLPQPPKGCRIVKTIYKMPMREDDKWPDAEIVTIDGQKIKIGNLSTTTYLYNVQGRISETRSEGLGVNERLSHNYTATTVTQHFISKKSDGTVQSEVTQKAPLNQQGFVADHFREEGDKELAWFEYDAEGHRIKHSYGSGVKKGQLFEQNIYDQGNLTTQYWFSAYAPGDSLIRTYSYNLSRPDLPVIYTYKGKNNRNLPVKILLSSRNNGFGNGPLYETRYSYLFDQQGRVRRRVAVGRQLNPRYLIDENFGTVNVTDYEYECS